MPTRMFGEWPHVEKTISRRALSAGEVATYIKLGRRHVLGSTYDPYTTAKDVVSKMMEDAMTITHWFNQNRLKWDLEHYLKVHKDIQDIQYGPSLYWKKVLAGQLTPVQFKAAESWALRHAAGHFVDMALACESRDVIFKVLDAKLQLRLSLDPYRVMLDVLRFAFHGLPTKRADSAFDI